MYVILDTNIWYTELGLNSTLGAAVRFFIKNKGLTVALPEVIKLETERNLKAALSKYIDDIKKNHRQLLAVFGKLPELVLPDSAAIDEKAASVFASCQLPLLELPLTLEAARSSFLKTIEKMPPSRERDQQFKDGVIWAQCLELLQSGDVTLVTSDKAFYRDRNPKCGLADNLKSEMKNCGHSFRIYETLVDFLQEIRTDVAVDQARMIAAFWDKYSGNIERMLNTHQFTAKSPPTVSVELFVTEDTNKLYFQFTGVFDCEDLLDTGRVGSLRLKGDGVYLVEEQDFQDLRSRGEELTFTTEEGEQRSQNAYVEAVSCVIGHRTVEHRVKMSLMSDFSDVADS